jgi:hypothetical protein
VAQPVRPLARRPLRTFGLLFVAPLLASALLAWWLIGDMSERGGYQPILPLPSSGEAAALAGVTGVLVALAFLRELWSIRRTGRVPGDARRLSAAGLALGTLTAFALRVLSAKTAGANIGGGIVMIYGPVLAVPLLVYAYRRWRALAR